MIYITPLMILIALIFLIVRICMESKVRGYIKKLNNYTEIRLGMSEDDVINILGTYFKKSTYSSGIVKYTYGLYSHYKLIKYINIYFKEGKVIIIDSSNL